MTTNTNEIRSILLAACAAANAVERATRIGSKKNIAARAAWNAAHTALMDTYRRG